MAIKVNLPSFDKRELTKGIVRGGLTVVNAYAMAPGVALMKATGSKIATALAYVGSVSIGTYVSIKEGEVTDKIVDEVFDSIEAKKEAAMAAKYAEVHFPEEEKCEAPAE